MSDKPKLKKDANGSMFLSVDDTNALRISLGLAPLKVDQSLSSSMSKHQSERSKDQTNEEQIDFRKNRDIEHDSMSVKERIELARKKRMSRIKRRQVESSLLNNESDFVVSSSSSRKNKKKVDFSKILNEENQMEDDNDDNSNTLAWVMKSRKNQSEIDQEEKKKQIMEEDSSDEEDQKKKKTNSSYSSKNLAGMNILHDATKFKEGEEVILTLKDVNVADENAEDELENVKMFNEEKRLWNKKMVDRTLYDYNAVDSIDNESKEDEILQKYSDSRKEMKRNKFSIQFNYDEDDNDEEQNIPKEDKSKSSKGDKKKEKFQTYSIEDGSNNKDSVKSRVAKDYEEKSSEPVKIKSKKKKGKRNIRKTKNKYDGEYDQESRLTSSNYNLANSGNTLTAAQILEQSMQNEQSNDMDIELGTRNKNNEENDLNKYKSSSKEKRKAYQRAINKVNDRSQSLLVENSDDEDTSKIEDSLERAKRIQNKKDTSVEETIEKYSKMNSDTKNIHLNQKSKSSKLVLDPTLEFCRTIEQKTKEAKEELKRRKKLEKEKEVMKQNNIPKALYVKPEQSDKMDIENTNVKKIEPEKPVIKKSKLKGKLRSRKKEESNGQPIEQQENNVKVLKEEDSLNIENTNVKPIEREGILDKEQNLGRGLSGALSFIMDKGFLKNDESNVGDDDEEELEQTTEDVVNKPMRGFWKDGEYHPIVVFDRRDEFGRKIDKKEAFRYISQDFHGQKPKLNKLEKKRKRYIEELRRKKMSDKDTPLNAVSSMKKLQERNQQAYVTLDKSTLNSMATSVLLEKENDNDKREKSRKKRKVQ